MGIVRAVLNGTENVPGIPLGKMSLSYPDGSTEVVEHTLSRGVFIMLTQLQALIAVEKDNGPHAEDIALGPIAEAMQESLSDVISSAESVYEDTRARIVFLERLITEIVRENIPSEAERVGAFYKIGLSRGDFVLLRILPLQCF